MNSKFDIILADDDPDDHYLFKIALNKIEISTTLKSIMDGEKLMYYLKDNLKNLPDVIFLDIHMPLKNGSECLQEIKKNKDLSKIPIVMFSTTISPDSFELFYKFDAFYCICKPSDPDMLINIIRIVLTAVAESSKLRI